MPWWDALLVCYRQLFARKQQPNDRVCSSFYLVFMAELTFDIFLWVLTKIMILFY